MVSRHQVPRSLSILWCCRHYLCFLKFFFSSFDLRNNIVVLLHIFDTNLHPGMNMASYFLIIALGYLPLFIDDFSIWISLYYYDYDDDYYYYYYYCHYPWGLQYLHDDPLNTLTSQLLKLHISDNNVLAPPQPHSHGHTKTFTSTNHL